MPRIKKFLKGGREVVARSIWTHTEAGHNQEAKLELIAILGETHFATPKPTRLIERILQLATDKSSLILDSFAGSGTTGHAVLKLNAADGGTRRFILIEMEESIAQSITAERLKRVLPTLSGADAPVGSSATQKAAPASTSQISNLESQIPPANPGLFHSPQDSPLKTQVSPGFQFCTLGDPLFDASGHINAPVRFPDLARHIFFSETGRALSPQSSALKPRRSPLIGTHNRTAYYLLFNGILGDKRPDAGNVLTNATLALLPPHPLGPDHPRVIFGEASRLSPQRLARENITFKQLPYEIKTT